MVTAFGVCNAISGYLKMAEGDAPRSHLATVCCLVVLTSSVDIPSMHPISRPQSILKQYADDDEDVDEEETVATATASQVPSRVAKRAWSLCRVVFVWRWTMATQRNVLRSRAYAQWEPVADQELRLLQTRLDHKEASLYLVYTLHESTLAHAHRRVSIWRLRASNAAWMSETAARHQVEEAAEAEERAMVQGIDQVASVQAELASLEGEVASCATALQGQLEAARSVEEASPGEELALRVHVESELDREAYSLGIYALETIRWLREPNWHRIAYSFAHWAAWVPANRAAQAFATKRTQRQHGSCLRLSRILGMERASRLTRHFTRWAVATSYTPQAELFALATRDFRPLLARLNWQQRDSKRLRKIRRVAEAEWDASTRERELDGLAEGLHHALEVRARGEGFPSPDLEEEEEEKRQLAVGRLAEAVQSGGVDPLGGRQGRERLRCVVAGQVAAALGARGDAGDILARWPPTTTTTTTATATTATVDAGEVPREVPEEEPSESGEDGLVGNPSDETRLAAVLIGGSPLSPPV